MTLKKNLSLFALKKEQLLVNAKMLLGVFTRRFVHLLSLTLLAVQVISLLRPIHAFVSWKIRFLMSLEKDKLALALEMKKRQESVFL